MTDDYVTSEQIAQRLGYEADYVRDTLTKLPGFPAPCQPTGRKSRRWIWVEVSEFMKSTKVAA